VNVDNAVANALIKRRNEAEQELWRLLAASNEECGVGGVAEVMATGSIKRGVAMLISFYGGGTNMPRVIAKKILLEELRLLEKGIIENDQWWLSEKIEYALGKIVRGEPLSHKDD
jgi:hypothetical protein